MQFYTFDLMQLSFQNFYYLSYQQFCDDLMHMSNGALCGQKREGGSGINCAGCNR